MQKRVTVLFAIEINILYFRFKGHIGGGIMKKCDYNHT